MQIRWAGLGTVELKTSAGTVICNPPKGLFGKTSEVDPNTVVTRSGYDDSLGSVPDTVHVIDSPGEYEVGGIGIRGVPTPVNDANDQRSVNTVYVIDADGLTSCHLGTPAEELTSQYLQVIGRLDLLIVPVGGQYLSPNLAAALVRQLEPSCVIPVGAEPQNGIAPAHMQFITELGAEATPPINRASISSSNITEDLKIVMLTPQQI